MSERYGLTVAAGRASVERMSVERLSDEGRRIVRHALDHGRYDRLFLNFTDERDTEAALEALA